MNILQDGQKLVREEPRSYREEYHDIESLLDDVLWEIFDNSNIEDFDREKAAKLLKWWADEVEAK